MKIIRRKSEKEKKEGKQELTAMEGKWKSNRGLVHEKGRGGRSED